jgi:hypothetical protein
MVRGRVGEQVLEEAKLYYNAARQSAAKGRKPSPLRSLTGALSSR